MIAPIDRIKLFDATAWEEFVLEWTDSLKPQYVDVGRLGGSGDQGRDVIGYVDDQTWDNYQCKHYARPLMPSDIWTEIGKVLHYTYRGDFTPPRRYYFVAPQGAGTSLSNLLRKPNRLREELLVQWTSHCKNKITAKGPLPLDEPLRAYIATFDFSIFGSIAPHLLIDGHATTRWHVARFGGGLPPRPEPTLPPVEPLVTEARYVRALLDAYADHLKAPIDEVGDLPADGGLGEHFADARREFYSAEALRAFSRDTLPPGSFDELKDQVHSGIGDDLRDEHEDGYRRLRAVVKTARMLALDGHPLNTSMTVRDRGGICHQLANDGTITKWQS